MREGTNPRRGRAPDYDDEPRFIIRPIQKTDLNGLVQLQEEFEEYLGSLDSNRKKSFSRVAVRRKLLQDGFGKRRAFNGFIATKDGVPVGFVFYHLGYDPDEMQGRVVYIIDLFVTGMERRRGVGQMLMQRVSALCRGIDAIDIYFGVWKKNAKAQKFYKALGAKKVVDVPFMHWEKASW